MRAEHLRKTLKGRPFEPVRISLSDGRSVLVRHPDQVFVAERHMIVGLATLERRSRLATPTTGDAIVKDWMLVNLMHVVSVEPADGAAPRRTRRK